MLLKNCIVLFLTFSIFSKILMDTAMQYGALKLFFVVLMLYPWCLLLFEILNEFLGNFVKKDKVLIQDKNKSQLKAKTVFIILFSIMMCFGIGLSIIYYPGIITRDSVSMYYAAQNFSDMRVRTDIHSFAYLCVYKLVFSFTDNYYVLTCLIILLFSVVWARYLTYLYQCGLRFGVVFTVTLGWLLIPRNWYMLITSWKDSPFTISMLILSYLEFP